MQSDIWSAGVILYVMLSGYPPFFANSDAEIFKKVLIGNFSFRGKEWKNISSSVKDLIRNMLIVNVDMRFNAQQVLEHPWLQIESPLYDLYFFTLIKLFSPNSFINFKTVLWLITIPLLFNSSVILLYP